MLTLSRYVGERIRLKTASGEVVWLIVAECHRNKVRIGIEADREAVKIDREELLSPSERHKGVGDGR